MRSNSPHPANYSLPHSRAPQHSDILNPPWIYLIVLLIGIASFAIFLPGTHARNTWIYSWDSAPYLEAAKNFFEGRGFIHRVTFGLDPEIWQPLRLWPPGYSVLIAGLHHFGIDGPTSCVAISVASAVVSLAAISFIQFRLFHWTLALPLIVLLTSSFAFQAVGSQCMSDSTYLALVAISIACLLQWTRSPTLFWAFAAGLLAGAAWSTRNAGLALFAATGIFFTFHLLWKSPALVAKPAIAWIVGVSICGLPLALRNIMTFGALNPYDMPPSELSLWQNLHRAFTVVIQDMSTSEFLAKLMAHEYALALIAVLAATSLGYLLYNAAYSWPIEVLERNRIQVLLVSYAAIYFTIIVIARTQFRWGDMIDARYMVQIYWVLWICFALWGLAMLDTLNVHPQRARAGIFLILSSFAALHLMDQWRATALAADRSQALEGRLGEDACAFLRQSTKPHQIVLAGRADILRIHCNVNARAYPHVSRADSYRKAITPEDIRSATERGHLWGMIIDDVQAALAGNFGPFVRHLVNRHENEKEWQRVPIKSPALILQYIGPNGNPPQFPSSIPE
jgi:hypothetical protein